MCQNSHFCTFGMLEMWGILSWCVWQWEDKIRALSSPAFMGSVQTWLGIFPEAAGICSQLCGSSQGWFMARLSLGTVHSCQALSCFVINQNWAETERTALRLIWNNTWTLQFNTISKYNWLKKKLGWFPINHGLNESIYWWHKGNLSAWALLEICKDCFKNYKLTNLFLSIICIKEKKVLGGGKYSKNVVLILLIFSFNFYD